jgi:uncharacterized protein YndB with AHSA1/START domain
MKPDIDVKRESAATGQWTRAPRVHGHVNRVESLASLHRYRETRSEAKQFAAIRVTRSYGVSPPRVFGAWLDPEVAGRWLFATASQPMTHVEIDGRIGGSFRFVERQAGETNKYTGQYVEIVPDRRLVFTLSLKPYPNVITRVTVAISPLAKGCELELIHENVPWDHASYVEGRWTGILYGLGVTLDSASATLHHNQD